MLLLLPWIQPLQDKVLLLQSAHLRQKIRPHFNVLPKNTIVFLHSWRPRKSNLQELWLVNKNLNVNSISVMRGIFKKATGLVVIILIAIATMQMP
nr:MAG TPA: hypothetical protein [Caudoviricetes sp.]